MLDPISALSVAAAIVQFADFSKELISKGKELYREGALSDNIELEVASSRLRILNKSLTESLRPSAGVLAERDQALEDISKGCTDVSAELVSRLEKLKLDIPNEASRPKWKSFRQALKSVSSKEEIQRFEEKLSRIRSELELHVLVSLREEVNTLVIQQDDRFQSLSRDHQSIGAALLENRQALQDNIASQLQALNHSQQTERERARTALSDRDEEKCKAKVGYALLESLRFETMNYRHESIVEAHAQTFEWIFQQTKHTLWSNFVEWLETGSGIYWISGKPGSGKSTLMKFIVVHEKTQTHLSQWATRGSLELPSFFFWNSGEAEQRSLVGLLRSLLFEILQKHMYLIPSVFANDWKNTFPVASHDIPVTFNKWSLARLKNAFKNLTGQASEHLRLCFFIDGLDEYEGDYEEIAEYFLTLSDETTFIKFCISSRPEVSFKETFGNTPKLRLQDLTANDIQCYIEDKVEANKRMISLIQKEPEAAKSLVSDLKKKAEGVFLWVTVVTKELLKGLHNMDNISDLKNRLDTTPADLDDLYAKMFASIENGYRESCSKIFQLHGHAWSTRLDNVYRSLIADPTTAVAAPVMDYQNLSMVHISTFDITLQGVGFDDRYDLERLKEYMETILHTRCGGLLEVKVLQISWIHRTAYDFIRKPKIWETMISLTPNFDPHLALLATLVYSFKTNCNGTRPQETPLASWLWGTITRLALSTKTRANEGTEELLLDEFNRAIVIIYGDDWTTDRCSSGWKADFLYIALNDQLFEYGKRKLAKDPPPQRSSGISVLAFILFSKYMFGGEKTKNFELEAWHMLEILLALGADPNESYGGCSIWQYSIHFVQMLGYLRGNSKALGLLLEHGADPNVCCLSNVQASEGTFNNGGSHDCPVEDGKGHISNMAVRGEYSENTHCLESVIRDCGSKSVLGSYSKWDEKEMDDLLTLVVKLKAQKSPGLQDMSGGNGQKEGKGKWKRD